MCVLVWVYISGFDHSLYERQIKVTDSNKDPTNLKKCEKIQMSKHIYR